MQHISVISGWLSIAVDGGRLGLTASIRHVVPINNSYKKYQLHSSLPQRSPLRAPGTAPLLLLLINPSFLNPITTLSDSGEAPLADEAMSVEDPSQRKGRRIVAAGYHSRGVTWIVRSTVEDLYRSPTQHHKYLSQRLTDVWNGVCIEYKDMTCYLSLANDAIYWSYTISITHMTHLEVRNVHRMVIVTWRSKGKQSQDLQISIMYIPSTTSGVARS